MMCCVDGNCKRCCPVHTGDKTDAGSKCKKCKQYKQTYRKYNWIKPTFKGLIHHGTKTNREK